MSVYRDFVPKALGKTTMFHPAEYEHFDAAAEAAIAWIKESGVQVLSIETVVTPLRSMVTEIPHKEGVIQGVQYGHAQFVRVWYM
jgi:hypothetical protein